ncbi:MAG: hypothetical protein KAX19_02400 [Candidatus Brocadiae bacterium]|nr:hypothetical protein [Candidatus Brocadiia bacterium]
MGDAGKEEQKKSVDELRDRASDLVEGMAELAQQVEGKVAAYTGAEPTDPTKGREPVPERAGHFPQLASYFEVIDDYIARIHRSIEQL